MPRKRQESKPAGAKLLLALAGVLIMLASHGAADNSPEEPMDKSGASSAAKGEFAYIVSIESLSPDNNELCTGVILDSRNILTAARCVARDR